MVRDVLGCVKLNWAEGGPLRVLKPSRHAERALHQQADALREADRLKDGVPRDGVARAAPTAARGPRGAVHVMKAHRDRAQGERARDILERQIQHMRGIVDALLDATRVVRRSEFVVTLPTATPDS
jgi:hypothetical protein